MTVRRTARVLPPAAELGMGARGAVALEVVGTVLWVRYLMGRMAIREVAGKLRDDVTDRQDPELAYRVGRRLAHPVGRTLEPLPGDSRCLTRSLVLMAMLARRGIFTDLVIGVRTGEKFEAHAWIEHRGRILMPTLGYEPLSRI